MSYRTSDSVDGKRELDLYAVPPASPETVFDWVRKNRLGDGRIVPVCLWGDAGVGKTAVVRSYCLKHNFGFRSYHPAHDTTGADLVGLPVLNEALGRTEYAIPMWQPSKSSTIDPYGMLFIDEINRAALAVLQGLMQLLGDGEITHSGYRMPDDWAIACAANPPDRYQVNELDPALIDRLLHLPVAFNLARWTAWAERAELQRDLVGFALGNSDLVASGAAHLPQELEIAATPRSLEYLARLYRPRMNRNLLISIALGLVGESATQRFLAWLDNPDRQGQLATSEELMTGGLAKELAENRAAAINSLELAERALAAMIRLEPTDHAVQVVAAYMLAMPPERSSEMWERMTLDAPKWLKPVAAAIAARRNQS